MNRRPRTLARLEREQRAEDIKTFLVVSILGALIGIGPMAIAMLVQAN